MNTNFKTTRKGININIELVELTENNSLKMRVEINEKKVCGILDERKKAITFSIVKFPKMPKGINGISLGDLEADILELYKELKTQKEEIINNLVADLITGKEKVKFILVGCDYKYFSPSLSISTDIIKIDKYDVMSKAITSYLGEIANWECLQYAKIIKEHEGEEPFELTLAEVLEKRMQNKKDKEEKLNKLFTAAKETGEKQEISHYTTGCNDKNEECDIDIVYEYAMPDGTVKVERIHTY
jgi:hypothetical protein